MRIRIELDEDDDEAHLCALIGILDDEVNYPHHLVRVKLRDGRVLFGEYEPLRNGAFVVANPWPPGSAGEHGWAPAEKGLIVVPRDVEWLEYVSETSPDFPETLDDDADAEDARDDEGGG